MEQALQELLPAITAVVMAIITGLLGLLTTWLREKFKVEIEARHRQALHSALETGTAYALEALGDALVKSPAIATADETINRIIKYTQDSVPDALRHFVPTREQLDKMARAKITEVMSRYRPDPLADALRSAGLPAEHFGRG